MNKKKNTILITGVMGHIGYASAIFLSKRNYKVVGIYNKSLNLVKKRILLNNNVSLIKNNLEKPLKIKKILKKNKIKNCLYCSAVSHDIYAKKDPEKTIKVNSLSLCYFLKFQRQKIYDKLIYISTGSVFQDIKSTKFKFNENVVPTPKSLYSSTKRLGEILIQSFFSLNKFKSCILRVSWVYGPPLLTTKINPQRGPIPYLIQKLIIQKKRNVKMKSGGEFAASFTYIDDVCFAIYKLLQLRKFKSDIYHLGSGKNNTNYDLIKIFKKLLPHKEIKLGKGKNPWSKDSVIRGPIVSKYNYSFLKPRYSLTKGIKSYIEFSKKK